MSGFNTPAAPNHGNDMRRTDDTAKSGMDTGSADMTDAAKAEAADLKDATQEQAESVVDTVKSETHAGADDAKREVHDLYDEARRELTEQASMQQERVAGGLRSISQELSSMADNAERPGVASDLVSQASDRAESVAFWLDHRTPGGVLEEVKSFARRKPGTFIAAAAIAGLLAGRLTRALTSDNSSGSSGGALNGGASSGGASSRRASAPTGTADNPAHALPTTSVGAAAGSTTGTSTADPTATNPAATDPMAEGDDHMRMVRGTEGSLPAAQPETPLDPARLREDLR